MVAVNVCWVTLACCSREFQKFLLGTGKKHLRFHLVDSSFVLSSQVLLSRGIRSWISLTSQWLPMAFAWHLASHCPSHRDLIIRIQRLYHTMPMDSYDHNPTLSSLSQVLNHGASTEVT